MGNSNGISFMRYEKGNLLDKKFKAIADSTRREILILLKTSPLKAGEIANHFTISFASVSHHLQKLEESGLVVSKRTGKYKEYHLCIEALDDIYLWIVNLIS